MSSEFIKMVSELNERRFLRTIQRLISDKVPCGIFFAPAVPNNAREIVDSLKSVGLNLNYVCVLSEEHTKFFQPVENEMLTSLETFPNLPAKPKFIFAFGNIGGVFANMFTDYFSRYNVNVFLSIDVDAAETQYNFYMKHLAELHDVHEMLADDKSKEIFRAAITGRITQIMQDFCHTTEYEYFVNGFLPEDGDIAIDGGAYDGTTGADFVRQGAKVYSFEMDADNYRNCLAPAEKFGFTIENLGLSNRESEEFYFPNGVGSRKIPGMQRGESARFIDLDTYVERKNLPRVDYIKFDIEGAELDALHGAAKTIVRRKPKMAICLYHKPEDFWTLPTYIKSLRSDYEFQFRHHLCERKKEIQLHAPWVDLNSFNLDCRMPSEYEMVLYCR